MYTLTYYTNKAYVVQGDRYVGEFESIEEARAAVKSAEKIYVAFPHNKGTVLEYTESVRQQMAIVPPKSFPI